jgi:hypothetical protein
LTFRITAGELSSLGPRHLAFGLLCTWAAGVGRYWDDPDASVLQHFGAGSVAYVLVLSALLWLIAAPLRPRNHSYRRLLTFVTMTSPPALLYAIPVERFTDVPTAASINLWFLAIVAIWRVSLLAFYFSRGLSLRPGAIAVATLLPITLIITALAGLNLEHATFSIMGGLRDPSAKDRVYAVVVGLSFLSIAMFSLLLPVYLWIYVVIRRSGSTPPAPPIEPPFSGPPGAL